MGCAVNGFLSTYKRGKTVYSTTDKTAINRPKDHTREVQHTFSVGKLFFIGILSFSSVTEMIRFFLIQILIFGMLRNNADVGRCSYFELGLPVVKLIQVTGFLSYPLTSCWF